MTPEQTPVVTDEDEVPQFTWRECQAGAPEVSWCYDGTIDVYWPGDNGVRKLLNINPKDNTCGYAEKRALPPSPDGMAGRLANVVRRLLDEVPSLSPEYSGASARARTVLAAYDAQTRETKPEGTLTLAFNSTDSGVDAIGSVITP